MNAQPVEFKTISEGWSVYQLADGSVLRGRIIVLKIMKPKPNEYAFKASTVFTVDAPTELRGPPSNERFSPEELEKFIVEEDIEFKPLKEEWNIFEVNDERLFIKLVVSKVSRTNKYDADGEPIYVISSQPIFKVKRKSAG
jgi:hypothetical protein